MVKLAIPLILIIITLLSDLYIYHRYIHIQSMWRWLWWLPLTIVICFLIKFVFFHKGFTEEYATTNIFLFVMVLFTIPKILFSIFSFIPKIGVYVGSCIAISIVFIVLYGISLGFCNFRIREITYSSRTIPQEFDGYKIVQISDAHVGTFYGPYSKLLSKSINEINNLNPDLICFVGDIENFSPEELERHKEALSSLKARDGVFSIMGNHDYSSYLRISPKEKNALVQQTKDLQHSFGWTMLNNEHRTIRHGNDSICIIGEENWGKPPFPQYGKIDKAIEGKPENIFSIMLTHDPTAWRSHVLPVFSPDITLSGHTHGTQFSIFGWSPASMIYKEWGGTYYEGKLMLSVSTGIGGNFPFRFGMPREAVVITLKRKR